MKNSRVNQFIVGCALTLLVAGFTGTMVAADKKTAADTSANGVPLTARGQPSVFNLSGRIKDPFFPKSTRTNPIVITSLVVPVITPSSFVLKGISGGEGNRLVLINNKNFAVGEADFVDTPAGRKKITVVKNNEFSAVV